MVSPILPRGVTRGATSRIHADQQNGFDEVRAIPSINAAPPRPSATFIPGSDILEHLIQRALAALSRGVYWDRGSIINILL